MTFGASQEKKSSYDLLTADVVQPKMEILLVNKMNNKKNVHKCKIFSSCLSLIKTKAHKKMWD